MLPIVTAAAPLFVRESILDGALLAATGPNAIDAGLAIIEAGIVPVPRKTIGELLPAIVANAVSLSPPDGAKANDTVQLCCGERVPVQVFPAIAMSDAGPVLELAAVTEGDGTTVGTFDALVTVIV